MLCDNASLYAVALKTHLIAHKRKQQIQHCDNLSSPVFAIESMDLTDLKI